MPPIPSTIYRTNTVSGKSRTRQMRSYLSSQPKGGWQRFRIAAKDEAEINVKKMARRTQHNVVYEGQVRGSLGTKKGGHRNEARLTEMPITNAQYVCNHTVAGTASDVGIQRLWRDVVLLAFSWRFFSQELKNGSIVLRQDGRNRCGLIHKLHQPGVVRRRND
jgi:hypothetical protein